MKKFILALLGVLLFTSTAALGDWCGIYGTVTLGGQPAAFAYVEITGASSCDTVQCNSQGYYQYTCFRGTYDMYAWKGGDWDSEDDVEYGGGVGGIEVNFQLQSAPPK